MTIVIHALSSHLTEVDHEAAAVVLLYIERGITRLQIRRAESMKMSYCVPSILIICAFSVD
jgi:hypothetical protein